MTAVRYFTTMLCGGKSMMLTPSVKPVFAMDDAQKVLGDSVLRASEDMIEFMYNDVKLTLYTNGSLMFYHFIDLEKATEYADEIRARITSE